MLGTYSLWMQGKWKPVKGIVFVVKEGFTVVEHMDVPVQLGTKTNLTN